MLASSPEGTVKLSTRPRKTASLSKSLSHQLNMYALSASAAGVGALALVRPAEGRIVYTPGHHIIGQNQHYNLDLNHDRVTDFSIHNWSNYCSTTCEAVLWAKGAAFGDNVEGKEIHYDSYADALRREARIGGSRRFLNRATATVVGEASSRAFGNWANARNRYLG